MAGLKTIYDGGQHCTATDPAKDKSVAMDCPYTGKGKELSAGELLEAALAGGRAVSQPVLTLESVLTEAGPR